MITDLPFKYKPRDYQKPLWRAMFQEGYKRAVVVWHRRAGKDTTCLNIAIAKSLERVGLYYYVMPELQQARSVIWKGMKDDGKPFREHFPPDLIDHVDNKYLSITLKNGSIFKLAATNKYNTLLGNNPVGIVLSEYSLQDPAGWDHFSPILAANDGWALFNFTPRGANHGQDLFEMSQTNKKWFSSLLTINDTYKENGEHIITKEKLQEEKDSGKHDDFLKQEYFCSFEAGVKGAYFSSELSRMHSNNQIIDFNIDPAIPVDTYWDLGYRDPTSIWFIQKRREDYIAIYYYENVGQKIAFYIDYLEQFKKKYGIMYGIHHYPHDGANKTVGTGESAIQIAIEHASKLGYEFRRLPRIPDKMQAVEALRQMLPRMTIHRTNCKRGIACLTEYHAAYNTMTMTYSHKPYHNWASHGVDALMVLAQIFREYRMSIDTRYQGKLRVNLF